MERISATSTRIVKRFGPPVAAVLAVVFLALAGLGYFVLGIGGLASLFPVVLMVVVGVGIRSTYRDLVDRVDLDSGGLVVRSGDERRRIPFERVVSVENERRNTLGVMIGKLPVIHVGATAGDGRTDRISFVPRSRSPAVSAASMEDSFDGLVGELRKRAEEARTG